MKMFREARWRLRQLSRRLTAPVRRFFYPVLPSAPKPDIEARFTVAGEMRSLVIKGTPREIHIPNMPDMRACWFGDHEFRPGMRMSASVL